jgi:hypothetical protein
VAGAEVEQTARCGSTLPAYFQMNARRESNRFRHLCQQILVVGLPSIWPVACPHEMDPRR